MLDPSRIALILLAAGQSTRFGSNKLAASIGGESLLRRTALGYSTLPFAARIVVAGPDTPPLDDLGFRRVLLHPSGAPQSASLAQGVAVIEHLAIDAALIALGDMPRVGTDHVRRLIAGFHGSVLASSVDGHKSPPALFPRADFEALQRQAGDRGARALLANAQTVAAPAGELDDVDTPDDLARLATRS